MIFIKYRLWLTSVAKYCKSFNFDSLSSIFFQNLICGNYTPSTPIPTHAAQESATVDFVNTGSTNLTTHAYLLSIRVVDHLSLAAIADPIMVEVEGLNHYGVGLFDFLRREHFLSRSPLRARSEKATINSSYKIQTYVFYIKKPEIRFLSITIHLSPSFLRKNSYS